MKTFLEYIADDLINKYGNDLSHIAVVFPNKRASLFLNGYLARKVSKPLWSPSYITISDLFRQHSSLTVGDPIKLICELHKVFNHCTGINEDLDRFYGWGQLLLTDFDDIDKNMADADKVFANLKDIHQLDDISYLTDEQKETLNKFFRNFSEGGNSELKERFLQLWQHFGDIYHQFNENLEKQQLAYEGALYRKVVSDDSIAFKYDTYVFIGFNVLQKVEQKLFSRLQKEGKAVFYWDFDKYYMEGEENEAGHYISQYLSSFPNELDRNDPAIYDHLNDKKDITYISSTTENMQARYISQWLREHHRIEDGRKTAIVLCDEGLLQIVIHCLPPEVTKVNITTGYPLSQSPVASLVRELIDLQTNGHTENAETYRLHEVSKVLRHPYAPDISPDAQALAKSLNDRKDYYPNRTDIATDEGLQLLFRNFKEGEPFLLQLSQYLLDILKLVGQNAKNTPDPLKEESIFRMYTLINRVHDLQENGDLNVNVITYRRLITQLIQTTSIPFHGEPAIGIQIMGILETRNLDFDHVLILSCNEGNMPKGVNDASFIPYSIRKAYGLTTIDNKVAIYAYYFHRLLQRAGDITILYNNATEDGKTGEMSRFMLQLMVESKQTIRQQTLRAGQKTILLQPQEVQKTPEIMEVLHRMEDLSPTAINRYLRCPLEFYYNRVAGIKEPEENDEDEIDNRIFGNIFHAAAQSLYASYIGKAINKKEIKQLAKDEQGLNRIVDEAFKKELFHAEGKSYQPRYNGLQTINRNVILHYLKQLLTIDEQLAPFTILDLEKEVDRTLTYTTHEGTRTICVGGFIDRLDRITDQEGERIRVIDYKTGKLPQMKTNGIDDIFDIHNRQKRHADYYLQTFLYALNVRNSSDFNKGGHPVSPALLFIQHTQGKDYDPTLFIGKDKVTDIKEYEEEYLAKLQQTISDIFESQLPFKPTDDRSHCQNCPYRQVCGI